MLVTLVIILLLIWAAVVWSIYSNFLVFYSNFSESENYHRAYYTSISALERWELVVKQRSPWYVWSGGFRMWTWMGSNNNQDWWSDSSLTWFSYLWDNPEISTVFWTVESKTTRIPATWEWNIEWMLSTWDSDNYNMMDYENAENFLLYIDESKDSPYKKVDCNSGDSYKEDCMASNPGNIRWKIRLPQLLVEKWFGDLDTNKPLVWPNESNVPKDDPIVDWQIRWNYSESMDPVPFTVFSTSNINSEGKNTVDTNRDSVFRESDINKQLSFSFWEKRTPFVDRWTHLNQLTVVSQKANNISGKKFKDIFTDNSSFSNVQLRFSLLNILKGFSGNNNPNVYPFLEYYVDFGGVEVPDRYYTITAEWNYADFQVNTIVRKPTTKETILWSFTSIF